MALSDVGRMGAPAQVVLCARVFSIRVISSQEMKRRLKKGAELHPITGELRSSVAAIHQVVKLASHHAPTTPGHHQRSVAEG
jgi:hypothetical protein